MIEIKWNNGMVSRSRTPVLFVRKAGGQWIYWSYDPRNIPGVIVIRSSSFKKGGRWSNTDYVLAVGDDVDVVEILCPFEGWGSSWADLAQGVKVHFGELTPELAAREVMPLVHNSNGYADAVSRAIECERLLAGL